MRSFFCTIIFSLFTLQSTNAQTPSFLWANNFGGDQDQYVQQLESDSEGNVFVAGRFSGQFITIGTEILYNSGYSDVDYIDDIFIAKYDQNGNVVWAKAFGGDDNDEIKKMVVDSSGNVLLLGYFYSTSVSFDNITLTNAENPYFMAKYDPNGNEIFVKNVGGISHPSCYDISIDEDSHFFITGISSETSISLGDTIIEGNGTFIANFFPNGDLIWAKKLPINDIILDPIGNSIYKAGYFYTPSISFEAVTLYNTVSNESTSDLYLAKFDFDGNLLWAKSSGGTGSDNFTKLTRDENGNLLIIASFKSPVITFGSSIVTNSNSNYDDAILLKYDTNGNELWAKSVSGSINDHMNDIATDSDGNIFIVGSFESDTLHLDTKIVTNVEMAVYNYKDIFIVKYNAAGSVLWAKNAGGMNSDFGSFITTNDYIYVSGNYNSDELQIGNFHLTNNSDFYNNIYLTQLDNSLGLVKPLSEVDQIFRIYPNPSTGTITIVTPSEVKEIMITDTFGKIIHQIKVSKSEYSFDLEKSGIYYITLVEEAVTSTRKIAVTK